MLYYLAKIDQATKDSGPTPGMHVSFGAEHRLNREFEKRFGGTAYAFEELVAELGPAFLCSAFRITNGHRSDHVAVVSFWLDILHRDTKAVFPATSRA